MLAPLDNEVVFKKAFKEPDVLSALVKDIVGIDFETDEVETEKQFLKNPGNIDQKYDIYAESKDHRVVVELQRVEYDYHFDRFLYYHNMAIAQLQETCSKYKIEKTVYTIVFLVQGYKKNLASNGEPIKDSVLISDTNPRNLKGKIVDIYGHKLIFLNSFYRDDDVPDEYKDWLRLIDDSINHRDDYHINENKPAIKKVVNLIDYDNITPTERRKMMVANETKAKEKINIEELEEVREEIKEAKKNAKEAKKNAKEAKEEAREKVKEAKEEAREKVKEAKNKLKQFERKAKESLSEKDKLIAELQAQLKKEMK